MWLPCTESSSVWRFQCLMLCPFTHSESWVKPRWKVSDKEPQLTPVIKGIITSSCHLVVDRGTAWVVVSTLVTKLKKELWNSTFKMILKLTCAVSLCHSSPFSAHWKWMWNLFCLWNIYRFRVYLLHFHEIGGLTREKKKGLNLWSRGEDILTFSMGQLQRPWILLTMQPMLEKEPYHRKSALFTGKRRLSWTEVTLRHTTVWNTVPVRLPVPSQKG